MGQAGDGLIGTDVQSVARILGFLVCQLEAWVQEASEKSDPPHDCS